MHRRIRCRGRQQGEKGRVHRFDGVVPQLVVPVYGPLRLPDALRRQIVPPGQVFLVPDQKVVPVVLHHLCWQALTIRRRRLLVPQPCETLEGGRELAGVHAACRGLSE